MRVGQGSHNPQRFINRFKRFYLQIFQNDNIWHKIQHVLLSTSKRHPEQMAYIKYTGTDYVAYASFSN